MSQIQDGATSWPVALAGASEGGAEGEAQWPAWPPLPPMPLQAFKPSKLWVNLSARHVQGVQAGLSLLPVAHWPETWQGAWQLHAAAQQKLMALQSSWWQGWGAWLQRVPQLQQANTVSKLIEQETDLALSALQRCADHCVDVLDLVENIQINASYWAQQQRIERVD